MHGVAAPIESSAKAFWSVEYDLELLDATFSARESEDAFDLSS